MYTCIHVYMYTCIHVYMYVYVYAYIFNYICVYIYIYTYVPSCVSLSLSIYIYIYILFADTGSPPSVVGSSGSNATSGSAKGMPQPSDHVLAQPTDWGV